MIHPNVFVFNFSNFCWVVAASLMANMGAAVFVADNISMCGFGSDRTAALLSVHRLSAAAVISLSSPVLRCCFRALLHFVRSAARPSQDMVSMSKAFISLTQTYLYRR